MASERPGRSPPWMLRDARYSWPFLNVPTSSACAVPEGRGSDPEGHGKTLAQETEQLALRRNTTDLLCPGPIEGRSRRRIVQVEALSKVRGPER
jgi:hypothetical protein